MKSDSLTVFPAWSSTVNAGAFSPGLGPRPTLPCACGAGPDPTWGCLRRPPGRRQPTRIRVRPRPVWHAAAQVETNLVGGRTWPRHSGTHRLEINKLIAEAVGTFFLVFFAVGVATLSFGFKLFGTSYSAGVLATALAFGLVMLAMAYTIGPISGAHINPAVTMGFLVSRRMTLGEAVGYWIAEFVGAIAGALVLWGVMSGSPFYSRTRTGLGANGFGKQSAIGVNTVGSLRHRSRS